MIKTVIIEDEPASLAHLVKVLHGIGDISVTATAGSVVEGKQLFRRTDAVDLIFSDVQLSDGLSFEIFGALDLPVPVIFTTGFDSFITRSFDYNGIDYLLKPFSSEEVRNAVEKYRKLERHFTGSQALKSLSRQLLQKNKRIIARKGVENVVLFPENIVLFYTENKVTYILTDDGRKFLHDRNLSELEAELDPTAFHRVNRKFILNVQFIKGFRAHDRVKLLVGLSVPFPQPVIVSQENAAAFKRWLSSEYTGI